MFLQFIGQDSHKILLPSSALFRYINMAHDVDLAPSQFWFCTAIVTVLFTSSTCSTLLILAMTFERFYSIIRPHKAASFNTVKRAKITILCIVIFSIVYNFPNWFITSDDGESRNCIAYAFALNSLHGIIYYWSSNILSYFLPFAILLIMNSVIIYTLNKRAKSLNISRTGGQRKVQGQVQSQGQSEGQSGKTKNSEMQVFVILLLVTFAYLILNTPSYMFYLYAQLMDYKKTPYGFAAYYLFFSVSQKTLYTNYGINFYLYVMSGQKFRTDLVMLLKSMLRCLTWKKAASNFSTSQSSSLNTLFVSAE